MCVAVIKPIGCDIPSDEILKRCFEKNTDGAGFSFSTGEEFVINKGLMTYDAFKSALDAVRAENNRRSASWEKDTFMAFHFRIGTHGSKNDPKHTHPFPVSEVNTELEATSITAKRIAMHNGILSKYGVSSYYGKTKDGSLSDTMDFIKSFIRPIERMLGDGKSIYDNEDAQNFISSEVSGSRFVIMYPDGRFIYWGDWKKHEGIYYSNEDYKAPAKVEKKYGGNVTAYDAAYWDEYDRNRYGSYKKTKRPIYELYSGMTKDELKEFDIFCHLAAELKDKGKAAIEKQRDAVAVEYGLSRAFYIDQILLEGKWTTVKNDSDLFIDYTSRLAYIWNPATYTLECAGSYSSYTRKEYK